METVSKRLWSESVNDDRVIEHWKKVEDQREQIKEMDILNEISPIKLRKSK